MIELKQETLEFSFPEVHPDAKCRIHFKRTMRIPDNEQTHYLPPSFGKFPLHHIDDFSAVPEAWRDRGGVFLPMYQSEAMWISFDSTYPCAIKIAAGKINAITGDTWRDQLRADKQDYVITPDQPWLDGFNVGENIVRQFVAMPLGDGVTAEEQLTGVAEFGGLQLLVSPMRKEQYEQKQQREKAWELEKVNYLMAPPRRMGLSPGGKVKQKIFKDENGIEAWDQRYASRCFVHIVNSRDYASITGSIPPHRPIRCGDYEAAGLPWYDYYSDNSAVRGSAFLKRLKSVRAMIGKPDGHLDMGEKMAKPKLLKVINKRSMVKDGKF
jgi:hypothetical protein